ncbi:nicotinate-nucleotide--dimethylbenzimidazole phosphoribosyltransferase [Varunaivibrio sulfuroxidans]|uniref:Nicotinate-nucleotide--dimethylbenzimidazole phosphoribosyltransferase n=1 Tax=Varunaivibrio sulfuroxidans TaxID=1773489 RepID=A0A4R3JHY9_9PROT|nr:nicotinate-nucleotide-dimethylbenzimidazole phosphoribosyltransferase [Varunaivibrio sulfuroxidans]
MSAIPSISSFDDIRQILNTLPGPDKAAAALCAEREPQLTKPAGSLGRLEQLTSWLAAWQHRAPPQIERPNCHVFAGNHGVVAKGVSAFPAEVTRQMVLNFENGGAAINQLCETFGVGLCVEAMDLDNPTNDFTEGPAMSERECVEAIWFGMNVVEETSDVVCLGEMGIGNTTAAAAICLALYGGNAASWTGPGTGVSGPALAHKAEAVAQGVRVNKAAMSDGLEVLRCLGGREMAALVGAVIGARLLNVPVLLDGFVCTAAVAPLRAIAGTALDHCKAAHVSAEPGHKALLGKLEKKPLLDQGMRLGEASGAVLAVALLKAAVACHTGMATFADAGVSDKGA